MKRGRQSWSRIQLLPQNLRTALSLHGNKRYEKLTPTGHQHDVIYATYTFFNLKVGYPKSCSGCIAPSCVSPAPRQQRRVTKDDSSGTLMTIPDACTVVSLVFFSNATLDRRPRASQLRILNVHFETKFAWVNFISNQLRC